MFIYQLCHQYWSGNRDPSEFHIGYYNELKTAWDVRDQYLSLPGFCDHPEGFQTIRHLINASYCTGIWVAKIIFDEYADEYVSIGVFESKAAAEAFSQQYIESKGFESEQGKLLIEEWPLNRSGWEEGFFIYTY